jgi:hypothetical protein
MSAGQGPGGGGATLAAAEAVTSVVAVALAAPASDAGSVELGSGLEHAASSIAMAGAAVNFTRRL